MEEKEKVTKNSKEKVIEKKQIDKKIMEKESPNKSSKKVNEPKKSTKMSTNNQNNTKKNIKSEPSNSTKELTNSNKKAKKIAETKKTVKKVKETEGIISKKPQTPENKNQETIENSTLKMNMELEFPVKKEKLEKEKPEQSINALEALKQELKNNIFEEIEEHQNTLYQEETENFYTTSSTHTEFEQKTGDIEIEKSLEQTTTIHIHKPQNKEEVSNAIADIFTGDYLKDPIMEEKNMRVFKREIARPNIPQKGQINKNRLILLIFISGLLILSLGLVIFIGIHFSSYNHHPEKVTMESLAPNYLFLGDSITEQYDLNKYFANLPVVNSGRGGYKTNQVLEKLEEMSYRYNPSKIFLLIGVNDITSNKSKTSIIDNIEQIIKELKENRPSTKIYVQSIYPTGDDSTYTVSEINKTLKKYCSKNNIIYIDVYETFKNKKGFIKDEYTTDGIHLSEKGYKKVTDIIKPYITEKEKD